LSPLPKQPKWGKRRQPWHNTVRKQAILNKLLSPNLISIAKLARDEHIAEQTLYNWRNRAKSQGKAVPTNDKTKELSPETKLTIIIDTAKLNETELAEYRIPPFHE
jgi:transposase